ncbi:hypothetical protein [Bradyrhizobium sp. ARR65]|uniref:type I-E CRISPR-associated protein Cse2/CasB n=1 Tax=Bradyrhizobium sp. ARR65 TaxID=1040989 RepID=UPI0004679274|nr:hypothetical protein [Bradyrhizobium sp. ARR65]
MIDISVTEPRCDVDPRPPLGGGYRSYPVDAPLRKLRNRISMLAKMKARGELAALRRLNSGRSDKSALFRLLTDCVPQQLLGSGSAPVGAPGSELDMVRRFSAVASMMALRPEGLRTWSLGRAMAEAGVTELRLSIFLAARGDIFRDLARRLARRLAYHAEVLPYLDLGRLLLMESLPQYTNDTDSVRIALARDFCRSARSISPTTEGKAGTKSTDE